MKNKFLNLLVNTGVDNKMAFIDEYGTYTYKEFRKSINCIISKLEKQSYPQGSNVIVYIENRMYAVSAIIALLYCRLIAIPVSISTPKDLLYQQINQIDAVGIITVDSSGVIKCITISSYRSNYNHKNTAMILFTSGTTGCIKAAELSIEALFSCVDAVCDYMQTGDDDRFFVIKDYVHCACLISEIFVALASGSSICLYNPRLSLTIIRKKILKDRPTIMGVNPWILEMLCKQQSFLSYYKSIKVLISSGSVLHKELKEKINQMMPDANLINVYGLTEASSRVCAQSLQNRNDLVSVGKPIKGVQVRIVNNFDDKTEIIVKSNGNMLGYYNDLEATESKIQDGWIYTGDTGYFDSNNNLVVLGRIDNLILSGSNKIDPERVSNTLKKFPGIEDAYTVGFYDQFLGEKVVSVIVYDRELDMYEQKRISEFCSKHLYSYECPGYVFCLDKLPRTPSGKIKKETILDIITTKIYDV